MTAVSLSAIMWFAERIMIGRLVQINERDGGRENEAAGERKAGRINGKG